MYGIVNKLIGGYCDMLLSFLRREPVLCAAAAAALLSMLAVPPSAAYLGYVDLRVLCLLFCLMAVVAGLQSCQLSQLVQQCPHALQRPQSGGENNRAGSHRQHQG